MAAMINSIQQFMKKFMVQVKWLIFHNKKERYMQHFGCTS
uniref:Uncharacterized protein n=1 Tax=Arundo donax TaxID=35708 RepID=A0A0A9BL04_ARUDO